MDSYITVYLNVALTLIFDRVCDCKVVKCKCNGGSLGNRLIFLSTLMYTNMSNIKANCERFWTLLAGAEVGLPLWSSLCLNILWDFWANTQEYNLLQEVKCSDERMLWGNCIHLGTGVSYTVWQIYYLRPM